MFGVLSNCIICTFSSAIRQKFTALHTSIYCLTIVPNLPAPTTMRMPAPMPIVQWICVHVHVRVSGLVMSWRGAALSYEWRMLLATDWMQFSTAIRMFFSYFLCSFSGWIPSANFNKISETHPSSVERESRYVRVHPPLTPIRVKDNVF